MKTATASNQRADLVGGYLSTQEVADALRIRRQTVAKALCLNGHYLGMKPVKLPNGRLLWAAADLERLTGADGK
ncbi:hypothetical protein [Thauera chlorobenzoica]|uniref:Uncharacterized protein n=1 Tax=Thauera chlorobenzoica TaxID=96773 RepID=A0A1H5Z438_9RHOO|nr:hypothetical protein [Thauera chlorobenzoica]APR05832.1 hypothetical protein Tchl_3017 [Thauera chlorobenzoica]SEG30934.1 hypothetical protein SAMN05216242_14013 [Thauera chlorobenzoica]